MIDQLVQQVVERTGISEEQARMAVSTVIEFVKQKLPEPFASQVDGFLSGEGNNDMLGQAQNLLGGLFGKQ